MLEIFAARYNKSGRIFTAPHRLFGRERPPSGNARQGFADKSLPRGSTFLQRFAIEMLHISIVNRSTSATEPFYASARAAALFLRIISHCWKMERMLLTSQ